MKRLTQRTNGVVVYVGAHNDEAGGQTSFEVSSRGVREILARLAEYEDTGLTPEEVTRVRTDTEAGYLKSIARTYGIDIGRMKELAAADREGRVVVRCRDCEHSYDDIGGRICAYGPCADCVVEDDFYCKNGRRGGKNDQD